MLNVRKIRLLLNYFLLLVALSVLMTAQNTAQNNKDEKDRDRNEESKKDGGAANLIKVEGKVRCDKPDPEYSIDVPDRPGHALIIAKRKCNWTEPMLIMGAKTKDGVAVGYSEKSEGMLHISGFETDTLNNGEKITWKSVGQVPAEKGPATATGRWSLMRGTGKLKGIKGGGSYEEKVDADDVLVLELEGVYDPSEIVGEKK
jgi:hypothetical protein